MQSPPQPVLTGTVPDEHAAPFSDCDLTRGIADERGVGGGTRCSSALLYVLVTSGLDAVFRTLVVDERKATWVS